MAVTVEMFTELLTPHLQAIRRLVHARLRGDMAEDVLQQALLRAFTRRNQLSSQDKFKSWLWSIAINEVRIWLRTTRPCISIDEFAHMEFTDQKPGPYVICEQRERADYLRSGLAKLKPRDRNAIRLADLDEMTDREAADTLGVSKAAFKSTHFRARQRLARAVGRAA